MSLSFWIPDLDLDESFFSEMYEISIPDLNLFAKVAATNS